MNPEPRLADSSKRSSPNAVSSDTVSQYSLGLSGLQHLLNPFFVFGVIPVSGHNTHHDSFAGDAVMLDPGNGKALIVDRDRGIVELVTAAAETRTLPDPTKSGIELALNLKTDGGDCVVTAATAINAAGNTIMTFADAADTIVLLSIPNGATAYRWKVIGNDGVSLS